MPIYQLSCLLPKLDILIVDEFLKFNGTDISVVENNKRNLLEVLARLDRVYSVDSKVILCSEFMHLEEYRNIFENLRYQVKDIEELVLETVPEDKRYLESARIYPIHEFACVKYLLEKGYQLKIGPSKEKIYDNIMQKLGFNLNFDYIIDAYALGTKSADKVIHYIPGSRGPNNGQRIFFDEEEKKIARKLEQGCDSALRYFCKTASVSGYLLDKEFLEEEEIAHLFGKRLKRKAIQMVVENIVKPYEGLK